MSPSVDREQINGLVWMPAWRQADNTCEIVSAKSQREMILINKRNPRSIRRWLVFKHNAGIL